MTHAFHSGSFVFSTADIDAQVAGGPYAVPLSCDPGETEGPCDTLSVFRP